ncbi:hypothetical protein, partial [Alistipes putredinis]|uniref:hypothetical protein n=1 Tax=Alistipes putredinis TaxID=28117 RepID=UPI003967BA64
STPIATLFPYTTLFRSIGACDSRPAVWRWHINGLARISARRVGRTEVACGDELQRQIFGRPVR